MADLNRLLDSYDHQAIEIEDEIEDGAGKP
jgi:hypothetical protein